jgi:hypothetical protein
VGPASRKLGRERGTRAFVTDSVFGGRETLRACILHPHTSYEHLKTLIAEVLATARTLVAAHKRTSITRGVMPRRAPPP